MDTKVFPVHGINRYLWSRIGNDPAPANWPADGDQYRAGLDILKKANYNGLTPIVPVEEIPELLEIIDAQPGVQSYPFIVYSWSRINNGQAYWMKTHNIAYSIRSTDDEAMGRLINLFETEFHDQDVAARRVNEFVALTGSPGQKRYRFTSINVQVLGAPMPAGTDTGANEALVTIAASYLESTQ